MKMQWESARKVDASDCANKVIRIYRNWIQLESVNVKRNSYQFVVVEYKNCRLNENGI